MRRHQQNHEKRLPCLLCGKTFHRQDLYDRHLATKQYVLPCPRHKSGQMTHDDTSDSSNSISRRDSATSGSLISSLPAQTSHSSSFSIPTAATHLSSAANSLYPNASQYNSDAQSSEDPSRYSADFVAQSTPSIIVSSDPISINDDSSFDLMK